MNHSMARSVPLYKGSKDKPVYKGSKDKPATVNEEHL
jgi:hypothetical protein